MRRLLIVLGVMPLLAPGCSSKSEEKKGSPEYSAFAERFANHYCELAAQCCAGVGTETDLAKCKSSVAAVLGANDASIANGRASYDAQAAEECLSELDAFLASCAPTAERPSVCDRVARGKLGAGAACSLNSDCAPKTDAIVFCKLEDQNQGVCVEQALPAVGIACDQTTCDSDPSLYCDFASGTCALRPGAGETCSIDVPCASGTTCIGTRSGVSECATDQAIGSDCSLGQPCAAGSYCTGGICTAKKAAGEACSSSNECLSSCNGVRCEAVEPVNIACFAST